MRYKEGKFGRVVLARFDHGEQKERCLS